jgi:hypothetical protein
MGDLLFMGAGLALYASCAGLAWAFERLLGPGVRR